MNGRKGMLTVFGAFVAPALLAFVVLKMGWFNAGVTNKGEFMPQELTLDWILPANPADSEWLIFYPMPSACEQACENVLYSLNQGFQALGKLQDKAHPVIVQPASSNISLDQLQQQYGYIKVLPIAQAQHSTLNQLSKEYIYLIDPFGKVVLRYPAKQQREAMIMVTKDWMEDLKRLLKYSRTS